MNIYEKPGGVLPVIARSDSVGDGSV